MSGNVGLNLYNAQEFKDYGNKVLKNCKAIVEKTTSKQQVVPVGRSEETENSSNNIDIKQLNRNTVLNKKAINNSSVAANNIYDDIQSLRNSLEGIKNPQKDKEDELDEVQDSTDYIAEKETDNTNEIMMSLHKNYQSKYGDKYFHGSATTQNNFQFDFDTKEKGFYSNNNTNIVAGTQKSATLVNASFEYGVASELVKEKQDNQSDKSHENSASTEDKSTKSASTRAEADTTPKAQTVPTETPSRKEINNTKSIDVAVLHNRSITINKREYIVGAGADYHNHDNGSSTQLTFRGGAADASSGFGLTVATTLYGSTDENGEKHSLRDTKLKAIILNNEIDEYPADKNTEEDEDISDLPVVKTKNKFGASFVTENKNIGVNASYVAYDISSLKNNTYKRNQLYVKAGYLNEPQGEYEPDKHKIKIGASWKYQKAESNGDYINAKVDAVYHNTLQKGETPDYLLGLDAEANTKIGHNEIGAQCTNVKTQHTNLLTISLGYKYSKNKWDIGAKAGYYKSDVFETKSNYITAEVNAAYKF